MFASLRLMNSAWFKLARKPVTTTSCNSSSELADSVDAVFGAAWVAGVVCAWP